MDTPPATWHDKTLVAWVAPANLTQRGGSVLTIDDQHSHFDALVFGELAPARWMAGSDSFHRTARDQQAWPAETADAQTVVPVAVVYRGTEVSLYRNGQLYARYTIAQPQTFGAGSVVLIGPRHLDNQHDRFVGDVFDARIYDHALTAEQVAALRPKQASEPAPVAWWTFDDPAGQDRCGRFPASRLDGGATIVDGRLRLAGPRAAWVAARTADEADCLGPLAQPRSIAAKPNLPGDIATVRRFRNHLLADPYRPTYHFVIPEDFAMPFDPNGAIFWRGKYHLFYIYQEHRTHVFGHVSSLDLVHWRQHPTPLYPTAESVDRGMFSGNCFLNLNGEATMLVHGVGAGNCLFTSTDDELDTWTRCPANPIVANPGADQPYASWDPCGWLEGQTYYAIFGGQPGQHPKPATVFKATDLSHWAYVGPFLHHEMPDVHADEDISCPDLFTLGGQRVLICISHNHGTRYYVGQWRDEQFVPEVHERLSWVDNLYFAPESCDAPDGRRILWAWIFDQRSPETRQASGWSGELALPRELRMGDDHRLRMRPVRELERLRYREQTLGAVTLAADQTVPLDAVHGNTIELELQIELLGAQQVGVIVARSPGGEEQTRVSYHAATHRLELDTTRSSLGEGPKKVESAPFTLAPGERLTLRVFVDRSVVEAFANDRQAALRRIYPTRPDSLGVALYTVGGAARVTQVKAWQMAPSQEY